MLYGFSMETACTETHLFRQFRSVHIFHQTRLEFLFYRIFLEYFGAKWNHFALRDM